MVTEQKIKDLQKKIAAAKQDTAKAEGALATDLNTLQEKFGVGNMEDAATKLKEIEDEIEDANKKIEELWEGLNDLT